jgi:hypothetical protein
MIKTPEAILQHRNDDIGKPKSILCRADSKPKLARKKWRTAKFPTNYNMPLLLKSTSISSNGITALQ